MQTLIKAFSFKTAMTAGDDDRRLISAAVPVLFVSACVFGFAYVQRVVPIFSRAALPQEQLAELRNERERIHPVLIEQAERPDEKTDEWRALSRQNTRGSGGITMAAGFHALSNDDTFQDPSPRPSEASRANDGRAGGNRAERPGDTYRREQQNNNESTTAAETAASNAATGYNLPRRIPNNYRFQQDLLLRFDGSSVTTLPSERLPGYEYFQSMLRKIRNETFAPPGVNSIMCDGAGCIYNQSIKPQVVPIQFALDEEGNVTDVRKGPTIGQHLVDEACINALRGQNFGPPPDEVLRHGNIFGINFIFADVREYRR